MSAAPRLELRAVSKCFNGVTAVNGVSLALAPGEFLSVLGPSGCGKSTTLGLIAGFESPDSGEVLIDGQRVNQLPLGRRGVGIVFQDYAVFTRMSVRENVSFGLEAQGVDRAARAARIADIAQRLGIVDLLDRRGRDLNVSEMQRVAFARAVVTQPRLLLLDEPMANLDSHVRGQLKGELRRIQRALSQSIVYVTHDQNEALALSDRIAVMNGGELIQVGTPDEIYRRPRTRFVAQFIGEPQINILDCTLRHAGSALLATTAGHTALELGAGPHPGGEYQLGIRPHDVRVLLRPQSGTAPARVRVVENLGAEHILHVEYGDGLLRAAVAPGTASADQEVHLAFDLRHALLIRRATGAVLDPERIPAEVA
jgi:multiple sugar transport system ATP-binding protein